MRLLTPDEVFLKTKKSAQNQVQVELFRLVQPAKKLSDKRYLKLSNSTRAFIATAGQFLVNESNRKICCIKHNYFHFVTDGSWKFEKKVTVGNFQQFVEKMKFSV